MVRMRNLVKVGNREVKKRYVGNKLIFEDLSDKTEVLSGTETYTDKADDSVVHVEIDGKSYQDGVPTPDSPSEIHSLNDFDVMSSVGKRNYWAIAKEPWHEHIRHLGGGVFTNVGDPGAIALFKMSALGAPIGETYTLSFEINVSNEAIQFSSSRFYINGAVPRVSHNRPTLVKHEWVKVYATFDYAIENNRYVHMYLSDVTDVDTFQIRKFKLEKGDITTDWTPAPEDILEDNNHPLIDKINILLDEPLRSVGDIKDRLFRDSDGIWKVERNVELIHPEDGTKTIEETYGVLDSPFYEILPQDYQDKLNNLRSFEDSNYVYSVINDKTDTLSDYIADILKPTLHTTFKSKGWYDYYQKTLLK